MPSVQKGPLIEPNVAHHQGWMKSAWTTTFHTSAAMFGNHDAWAPANTARATKYEGSIFSSLRSAKSPSAGCARPSRMRRTLNQNRQKPLTKKTRSTHMKLVGETSGVSLTRVTSEKCYQT